jgi:hypothetical protein
VRPPSIFNDRMTFDSGLRPERANSSHSVPVWRMGQIDPLLTFPTNSVRTENARMRGSALRAGSAVSSHLGWRRALGRWSSSSPPPR